MSLVRGHSPDGAYFLDCTNPSTGEQKSVVGYYSNIPDGGVSNGQAPDSTAVMTVPQQGFQQWASAGEPERAIFDDTGAQMLFNITPAFQSEDVDTLVGTASSTEGSKWNIYKDDGKVIFTDSNGFECKSQFWCF